jgi:hypothetical protein
MDLCRIISEFVKSARILFDLRRSKSEGISRVDSHLHLTQLLYFRLKRIAWSNPSLARQTQQNALIILAAMSAYLQVGDRTIILRCTGAVESPSCARDFFRGRGASPMMQIYSRITGSAVGQADVQRKRNLQQGGELCATSAS